MQSCCFRWGVAAAAVVLALSGGTPLKAAESAGVRPVAEELGQRAAVPQGQQKGGLSDSAVRVLMSYAFSVIPEQQAGPDGKPVKLDKSDPSKFLIPDEDARRIIRAATRSAYADACGLPDLAQANHQALLRSEAARKVWSEPQFLMVNALYVFSASYFAGNVKITEGEDTTGAAGAANPPKEAAPAPDKRAAPGPETSLVTPKRPQCPPEQKQKVVAAINAYVQSIPAGPPPKAAAPAPAPAQPASSSAN